MTSPLKSYQNPIGKARLPTSIFQGRSVKLQGCTDINLLVGADWFFLAVEMKHPENPQSGLLVGSD